MLRRVKFYKHVLLYNCSAFLCNLFLIVSLQNFCNDDVQLKVYGLYSKLMIVNF